MLSHEALYVQHTVPNNYLIVLSCFIQLQTLCKSFYFKEGKDRLEI